MTQKTDIQNVRNITDMNTCIVWLLLKKSVLNFFFVCLFVLFLFIVSRKSGMLMFSVR